MVNMPEDDFTLKDSTIAIIGLGLMGGSLAMALKGHCRSLIGLDTHPEALEAALAKQVVDQADADPAKLLPAADLVILAAPVPAIIEWLKALPRFIERPCIVLDIGSTKRAIMRAMEALPANFDPIGGHPICGREQLTLQNADAHLFHNAPFVITSLARTTKRARSAAQQIISKVGAHMLELTAEQHDHILAASSHLPFLLASALALGTPAGNGPFIGSGFRSTARLAGTPASMMLGVLESNRDNISKSIQHFRESLSRIESALNSEDSLALADILDQSRHSYESLVTVNP
jgi:prephenate dehydrogenase